ncbi:MAG: nuclear transport factor 2 family protein [Acidobacteria bacterium]|nr:nuclear transport factor 2 family protein [Acidobacteriota bacterium]
MTDLIALSESHFEAVAEKNIDRILNFYADAPELLVFVEGPRWATRSFENVSRGWVDFVGSAISVKSCRWVEIIESRTFADSGFVAGIVEMIAEIGGNLKTIRFRGTFVFQKEADENWRVIHEHFSQPAEDPYGIGDWLKTE